MENWFWILGLILSILTITGNGFIIFLVSSKRQLRTKTKAFIVSLAVADFFVGLSVVPPLFFCDVIKSGCNWPRASHSLWRDFIKWLFGYASTMNLCSLVLDRYIAVVHPLKNVTFMTRRRVIQMISFSWAIPFGFVISLLLLLQFYHDITPTTFILPFTTFVEIVSCCMLIFCFTSMVLVVYKHDRSAATLAKQLSFNHRVLKFNAHDKSAFVMMAIVVALFLACYGIYLRCSFVYILNPKSSCNDSKYKLLILVLNSAVNPLAYAFFKRDIKKEIKRLICIVKRK